jgi:hypothetical protein
VPAAILHTFQQFMQRQPVTQHAKAAPGSSPANYGVKVLAAR